jgi:hypothetical protein
MSEIVSVPSTSKAPVSSLDLTSAVSGISQPDIYARVQLHLKVDESADYMMCLNSDAQANLYHY